MSTVPTYTVRFYGSSNTVLKEASGYKFGDAIGSKIPEFPPTGYADAEYYDANAWQYGGGDVAPGTAVNGDMDIRPKAYRNVTFKGEPGSNQPEDSSVKVEAGQFCYMPSISISSSREVQGIIIETVRNLEGWFDGNENKGDGGSSFTPLRKDTTLTPRFSSLNSDMADVTVYTGPIGNAETTEIKLGLVSVGATIYLSNLTVVSVGGQSKTGWTATVDSSSGHTFTDSLRLADAGAVNNSEVKIEPTYDVTNLRVIFRSQYGFEPGTPDASYGVIAKDIKYNETAGIDKAGLDKRVKLPVPNPITYYAADQDGNIVEKKITFFFDGDWVNTANGGLWAEDYKFTQNAEINAVIRTEPPEEDPSKLLTVEFYNTAKTPYELVARKFVEKGSIVPKEPLPERVGNTCLGWSQFTHQNAPLYDFGTPVNGNLKLYTAWAQDATITLNSDGGGLIYVEEVRANETLSEAAIKKCLPENVNKDGIACRGWAMNRQNGRVVDLFSENKPFDITQKITPKLIAENDGQIKLWAWYEEPNTTVNFHHNFVLEGKEEKVHTEKISRNQPLRLPNYTPPEADAKPGHNFQGWSLSSSGGQILEKGYPIPRNETIDVYAQWAQGFTLKYMCGSKLVATQFFATLPDEIPPVQYVPPIVGTNPAKWVSNDEWYTTAALETKVDFETVFTGTELGKPVIVYGKLVNIVREPCKITLMSNDGVFSGIGGAEEAEIDAMTGDVLWANQEYSDEINSLVPKLGKGDYRELFGWFFDAECTMPADPKVPLVGDATYYAGWACPVTFKAVGGVAKRSYDGTTEEKFHVRKGENVECVVFPDKIDSNGANMHLAGWKWEYTGTVDEDKKPKAEFWDFQIDEAQNKLDLTAVWDYRVKYDPQGGTLNGVQTLYVRETAEDRTLEKPSAPQKDGFDFQGWVTNPDESSSKFVFRGGSGAMQISQNMTLYALWEKKAAPVVPPEPVLPEEPEPTPPNPGEPTAPPPSPGGSGGSTPAATVPKLRERDAGTGVPTVVDDTVATAPVGGAPVAQPNSPSRTAAKLPYSGANSLLPLVGVALMLPWLSSIFFQKFKLKMAEDSAE